MVEGRDDLSRQNQNQDNDETARNLAADGTRPPKQDDPLAGAWNSLNTMLGDAKNQALDGMVGNDSTKKIVDNITPEVARQYQSGKGVQERIASGQVRESELSGEDRINLNAYREVNNSVSKLPFYDQNALMKHVEEGIARKASRPVAEENRAGQNGAQRAQQIKPDGDGGTSKLPSTNGGRIEPQLRDDRAAQRLSQQAANREESAQPSGQTRGESSKFHNNTPSGFNADGSAKATGGTGAVPGSLPADRQTNSLRGDALRSESKIGDGSTQPNPNLPSGNLRDRNASATDGGVSSRDNASVSRASRDGGLADSAWLNSRELSGSRDGSSSNRDGNFGNRDGSASNRDGSASNRDGSASDRDGSASNRDGNASNRDGSTGNQRSGAPDSRDLDGGSSRRDGDSMTGDGRSIAREGNLNRDNPGERISPVPRADRDGTRETGGSEQSTRKQPVGFAPDGKADARGDTGSADKGVRKSGDALVKFGDLQLDGKPVGAPPRLQNRDIAPPRTREFVIFDPSTLKSAEVESERAKVRAAADRPPVPKIIPDENVAVRISWSRSLSADRNVMGSGGVSDGSRGTRSDVTSGARGGAAGADVAGGARGGAALGDAAGGVRGATSGSTASDAAAAARAADMQGRAGSAQTGGAFGGTDAARAGQGRTDGLQGRIDVNVPGGTIKGPQGPLIDATGKPILRADGTTFRCTSQQIVDKRYITGTEIALAAIIAAAGARRVQHDRTTGMSATGGIRTESAVKGQLDTTLKGRADATVKGQLDPNTRSVIPNRGIETPTARPVNTGARAEASDTRIVNPVSKTETPDTRPVNPGARPDTSNVRPDGFRLVRPGETRTFICAQRIDKRYVTGAEIALATIIVAAGMRRSRADEAVRSIINRTVEPTVKTSDRSASHSAAREITVSGANDAAIARGRFDDDIHSPSSESEENRTDEPHVVRSLQDVLDETHGVVRRDDPTQTKDERERKLDSADESSDESSQSIHEVRYAALIRPTVLISLDETLVTLAEKFFLDRRIGWLIADLNKDCSKQSWVDGKRVCEFKNRQVIVLPVAEDFPLFFNHLPKYAVPENLITIVEQTQVDIELLSESFSPVMGRLPQRKEITSSAASQVADLTLTGSEGHTLARSLDYFVTKLPSEMVDSLQIGSRRLLRRTSELKKSALKRFIK